MLHSTRELLSDYTSDRVEIYESALHSKIEHILKNEKDVEQQITKIVEYVSFSCLPGLILDMFEEYERITNSNK